MADWERVVYASAWDRVPGGISVEQSDLEYYRARIAEEEIAAQRASHPLAAESHKRLAEEYASLIVANGTLCREEAGAR